MKPETLYREIGRETETCSHGCAHDVRIYETVQVTRTGEKRLYDDGYQRVDTPLAVDGAGQTYHQHVPLDFTGGLDWSRDTDNTRWLPSIRGLARDGEGRPLTDATPPTPIVTMPAVDEVTYEFGFTATGSDGTTSFLTERQLGIFGDYAERRARAVSALERGENVHRRRVVTFKNPDPVEGDWVQWGSPAATAVIP